MRLVRRLGGVLGGAAGAVGLVLCVAGLVGVSVGYVDVARRLERVFDRADNTLAATQENIRAVADRLRRTEADLDAVRKWEAEAAAEPPDRRAGRRVASRKAVEALGVDVAEARSTLVK